eukprot:m.38077 g.38077  ORF g.38077 m.38077 type:complete len:142 (-) comp10180_c1_seq4:27-452(-)
MRVAKIFYILLLNFNFFFVLLFSFTYLLGCCVCIRTIPLDSLSAISVSKYNDNIIVLHSKHDGYDLVFSIGGETDNHLAEFVARLYLACRSLENRIPVNVCDTITFNNSTKEGEERTLQFMKNPTGIAGTRFQRPNTVLYG